MDRPLVVIADPVHPDVFETLKPHFRLMDGEEGFEHVLLGSDYPFDLGNLVCVRRVEEIGKPREQRDSILGARAKALLKWPN